MKNKALRYCALTLALYLLLGVAFFFIAGDSLHYSAALTNTVSAKATLGELLQGQKIEQTFVCDYETLTQLGVRVATSANRTDRIQVQLMDENGELLLDTWTVETNQMNSNELFMIELPTPLENTRGKKITLQLMSLDGTPGNAVAFY